MRKGKISIWFLTVVLIITVPLVAVLLVHWYQYKYCRLPIYGNPVESAIGTEVPHTIDSFELVNQAGQLFSSAVLKNKIVVFNFFFTSCGSVCPKMMENIKRVEGLYSTDTTISFVSFTVDPEHDNPDKLKRYTELHGINTLQWVLLTGDKKKIYRLARKSFYLTAADGDGGEDDFIHSEQVVLVDSRQHIRGYYPGTDDKAVNDLKNDINKLQHEE